MVAARLALLALSAAALLALAAATPAAPAAARVRRQLADDNTLQPLDDASSDDQAREKRKLEGVTQAKFGIKNAVLGFVFGKINSLIDSKTRFVESLDRQNIELNKQYGIEAPKGGGLSSLSGIVGQVIGPKLQFLGPKIQAVTGLLGGASGGGGSEWRYVEAPDSHKAGLTRRSADMLPAARGTAELSSWRTQRLPSPDTLSRVSSSSTREVRQTARQATPADDIPVFDRNKVSLDFPGSLFGPSVSLLIRTTKIIGDVIQNSAVRYQSFLRLFRPLFRGPFEIKGLDPPTTTTTTRRTTTTRITSTTPTPMSTPAPAPAQADNEINRRR